ncbi:MAG: hypothetical protein QXH40_04940 [Candidatus Bathyarchaeia archaeon]
MQGVRLDATPARPTTSKNHPTIYHNPKRVGPPSGRGKSPNGA